MCRIARTMTLILVLSPIGFAQVNQTMLPNYDTYTTLSGDANNNIYQTVVVEGTTTGSCTQTITVVCGPYGQTCTYTYTYQSCLTATHTPTITNKLGTAGGTTTGPAVSPFSWLSYQTTTVYHASPGQDVPSTTQASVVCSVVGPIFNPPPVPEHIAIATVVLATATQNPGTGTDCYPGEDCTNPAICNTMSSCTAATSPPTCTGPKQIKDASPVRPCSQCDLASYALG